MCIPPPQKAALCQRLSALTFERWGLGPGKTILGNSGSDAVEAALKTSLLHSGKPGVIAFTGAYHGLGMGALAAGGLPFFRDPFGPQLKEFATWIPYPHCFRCPFGVREAFRLEGDPFPNCSTACLAQIHAQISRAIAQREIGCILVEPIQGRGGIVPPPRDFLPMLRRICDEEKILLIADEIFTGFNRTGKLFACDHFGVVAGHHLPGQRPRLGLPDLGLRGPNPRHGRVAANPPAKPSTPARSSATARLRHGAGLAGTPRAARNGQQVRAAGRKLRDALRAIASPAAGNIRGAGLMLGLEIIDPPALPTPPWPSPRSSTLSPTASSSWPTARTPTSSPSPRPSPSPTRKLPSLPPALRNISPAPNLILYRRGLNRRGLSARETDSALFAAAVMLYAIPVAAVGLLVGELENNAVHGCGKGFTRNVIDHFGKRFRTGFV